MAATALTELGALLADKTRTLMLTVLLDGRARTGGELARLVGVAPSTASEHLSRLLDAQFVAVEAQGRHRYFRLAGPEIAELLETLGAVDLPGPPGRPVAANAPTELRNARCCYDHLAGQLGVRIFEQLLAHDHLRRDENHLTLTESGHALLTDLGADMVAVARSSRPVVRGCLDWTERRQHLAGGAGAALFQALLDRRWIVRGSRPRSIRVTDAGQRGLRAMLGA